MRGRVSEHVTCKKHMDSAMGGDSSRWELQHMLQVCWRWANGSLLYCKHWSLKGQFTPISEIHLSASIGTFLCFQSHPHGKLFTVYFWVAQLKCDLYSQMELKGQRQGYLKGHCCCCGGTRRLCRCNILFCGCLWMSEYSLVCGGASDCRSVCVHTPCWALLSRKILFKDKYWCDLLSALTSVTE